MKMDAQNKMDKCIDYADATALRHIIKQTIYRVFQYCVLIDTAYSYNSMEYFFSRGVEADEIWGCWVIMHYKQKL